MNQTAYVARRRGTRRRHQQRTRSAAIVRGLIATAIAAIGLAIIFAGGGTALAVGGYFYYARGLPNPQAIVKARQQFETTLIYDRTGQNVLYQVSDPSAGDRLSVPLSEIPRSMIDATIAIEDKSFYQNPGFDIRGILRSIYIAVSGGAVQGGSTITQQLVKNILLASEGKAPLTLDRKIKEIILASEISRLYSKDQILEWYLNNNFYGNLAYGVQTAARVYFSKPAKDLTLAESAMLAAIPQNPQYNPLDNPVESQRRQITVLDNMVRYGFITADQAREAASQVLVIFPERSGIIAPHFSLYARGQAEQILNAEGLDGDGLVSRGGLRIYTTLDLDLQYQAECVTRGHIERISGGNPTSAPNTSDGKPCLAAKYLPTPANFKLGVSRNVTNAAAVVMRPNTGEILAMVGSLDYWNPGIDGNYNAALGLRQPGSTFKPFVYVTAFALKNDMPSTMVLDIPRTFDQDGVPYTPNNEDHQFHGPMTIREALANSYNIPVVQVMSEVGIGQVIRRAHQMGINSLDDSIDKYGLALALGSGEVRLTDLTYAYSVFANLGYMAGTPTQFVRNGYRAYDPIAILRIEDKDGNVLWTLDEKNPSTFGKQNVLNESLAYLITNILSDKEARLPFFGADNPLQLSRPAAAKTGTTNDARDAWTVGYTPQLVTGVWVGNNNDSPMGDDVTGSAAATPIWHAIMEYAHQRDSLPMLDWKRPDNITERTVCKYTGLLPTADCPTVKDLFIKDATTDTIPTDRDTYWKRYQINARNGLLATAYTPPNLVTEKVFFNYPPEALDWARSQRDKLKAQGREVPPSDYDSASAPTGTLESGAILSPGGLDRVRGTVPIRGNIDPNKVASYTLAYGAGLNPTQWITIPGGDPSARGTGLMLGMWDTTGLDGLYTVRLGLTLKDGNRFEPFNVEVTVDNQPPTAAVAEPQAGALVKLSDKTLPLAADVSD
ncbi:MAG TPA: transglycosylase domain-containing protein, partial [Aggregatilineales bacterium]|nr:transglycosylase domain-containing protein [Aggregatilineales bacterium]